ncbi:MAG: ABC transporter permease [Filifactor alocis]|nr:ABC transporter permease [Filifactor alocis]
MFSAEGIALVVGNTLMFATPLLYAALGGMVSEKSGVVNLGLEGMMTIGALVAATVGYYTQNPWLAFASAGLAGGLLALVHAIVSVSFGADQIVSGIAINFLGPGIALFMSRLFFEGATQTKPIENKMPILFKSALEEHPALSYIFAQYATVYIALALVVVLWIYFYRTKYGLRHIAVGEHPKAAETLNINVYAFRYWAVIVSGILAGFGGASLSLAIVSSFRQTLVSGQGFIALVALIFGKWTPHGVLGACIFFGFAQAISIVMGMSDINVSTHLIAMVPYVSTLLILILFVGRSRGPKANGQIYLKDSIDA